MYGTTTLCKGREMGFVKATNIWVVSSLDSGRAGTFIPMNPTDAKTHSYTAHKVVGKIELTNLRSRPVCYADSKLHTELSPKIVAKQ